MPTEGGFRYANELVAFIHDRCDMCIGATCYPEAPGIESNPEDLKRKVDAGLEFLISQLFFNNDRFL